MDLDFSPEDQAFREEVRAWMRANVPPKAGPEIGLPSHLETQAAWERKLGKQGWLAYNWPTEYGGPGWTATQRYIFDTERAAAEIARSQGWQPAGSRYLPHRHRWMSLQNLQ